MKQYGLILIFHALINISTQFTDTLYTVAAWNYLTFKVNTNYKAENAITTGVTVTNDRIFLSIPRFKPNVPATIGSILKPNAPVINPEILPFPDEKSQFGYQDGCQGLVSVFRTRLDKCGRLWTVDSGFYNNTQVCPAKLLVYDITNGNDQLIKSAEFPKSVLKSNSLLTFLILDEEKNNEEDNCDPAFVYVTDPIGYGLIVFDVKNQSVWRFEHDTFRFNQNYATITIAGESTTTDDGIIALTIAKFKSKPTLFYHSLSDNYIHAISTAFLRDNTNKDKKLPVETLLRKTSPGVGLTSICSIFDTCHIIYSPSSETSIDAWNPDNGSILRLAYDNRRLQYISDMTYSFNTLWILSNRFQSFDNSTYLKDGINIRILQLEIF